MSDSLSTGLIRSRTLPNAGYTRRIALSSVAGQHAASLARTAKGGLCSQACATLRRPCAPPCSSSQPVLNKAAARNASLSGTVVGRPGPRAGGSVLLLEHAASNASGCGIAWPHHRPWHRARVSRRSGLNAAHRRCIRLHAPSWPHARGGACGSQGTSGGWGCARGARPWGQHGRVALVEQCTLGWLHLCFDHFHFIAHLALYNRIEYSPPMWGCCVLPGPPARPACF